MGSAASNPEPVANGEARRRSTLIPKLVRVSSERESHSKFNVGFTLEFGDSSGRVPEGMEKCSCGECDFDNVNLFVNEYIEEESKSYGSYKVNPLRSGSTTGGAKFQPQWYHPRDIPHFIQKIALKQPGGTWKEEWHVTPWVKYNDPYSKQRSRFRIWRRIEERSLNQSNDV